MEGSLTKLFLSLISRYLYLCSGSNFIPKDITKIVYPVKLVKKKPQKTISWVYPFPLS